MECASTIFSTSDRQQKVASQLAKEQVVRVNDDEKTRVAKTSDQKYYLRNSNYRHLPLTLTQSTKINALLMKKNSDTGVLSRFNTSNQVMNLLSPRQQKIAELVAWAKKLSPDSMNTFVFPEDDSKLNEYYDELARAAQKVISGSKK